MKRSEMLSPRQQQVLEAMLDNISYKDLGKMLGITEKAIRTHAQEVFKKYKVHNRRELLALISVTEKSKIEKAFDATMRHMKISPNSDVAFRMRKYLMGELYGIR